MCFLCDAASAGFFPPRTPLEAVSLFSGDAVCATSYSAYCPTVFDCEFVLVCKKNPLLENSRSSSKPNTQFQVLDVCLNSSNHSLR